MSSAALPPTNQALPILTAQLTTAQTNVTELQAEVADLTAQLATAQTALAATQAQVQDITNAIAAVTPLPATAIAVPNA